jgi:hypothetical protein
VRPVFTARDPVEAHLLRAVLESEGIAAEVRGEYLFGARGGVPFDPSTAPSVWIEDDAELARARAVVEDFARRRDLQVEQ